MHSENSYPQSEEFGEWCSDQHSPSLQNLRCRQLCDGAREDDELARHSLFLEFPEVYYQLIGSNFQIEETLRHGFPLPDYPGPVGDLINSRDEITADAKHTTQTNTEKKMTAAYAQ